MNCSNCAAPLPPKENLCRYCGTRNQVDLRALPRTQRSDASSLCCPRCSEAMSEITLELERPVVVEHCRGCGGIFFDPAELELVLEDAVEHVHEPDYSRLKVLTEKEYAPSPEPVRYFKCPHCRKFMNRKAYGTRSGVIVDTCKEHGMWLEGGELDRLLTWSKAGGRAHHQLREADRVRQQALEEKMKEDKEKLDKALGMLVADLWS